VWGGGEVCDKVTCFGPGLDFILLVDGQCLLKTVKFSLRLIEHVMEMYGGMEE
jgi:hypothetical protein